MTEQNPTPGPWAWQKLGDWCLVGQHGIRPIVLNTGGPGGKRLLRVRDAERDLMVPLDPAHPDARLIAAAPDYALLLRGLLAGLVRVEPLGKSLEVCVSGIRFTCTVDDFSLPQLTGHCYDAIEKALEQGGDK